MSVIWWTDDEREILKNLYPKAEKKIILKTLKNKSWYACQKEARRLGLKRLVKKGRPKKKKRTSVGKKQLEKLLNETDLTIYEIAVKLNTTPDIIRRTIFKYGL